MAQVKKISVAKVYGKIQKQDLMTVVDGKVVPKTDPILVMRVGGLATGIKEGVSDNGPWKALMGDFVAYSAKDGEEHRAPYCFLPDVAFVPMTVALSQSQASGIRFLVDLYVKHDEQSATGYVYTFVTVKNPSGEDPIKQLLADVAPLKIGEKVVGGLMLEAPKGDESQAASTAPASQEKPQKTTKGK